MRDAVLVLKLPDVHATQRLGEVLGRSLPAGSILLLEGDLGSGKTTLVQGIGLGLGIQDAIVSPTFVLVNEYDEGRIPLYHFDLYRLEPTATRALAIDTYWDGVEYEPGIVAIEWPERLGDRPPYALQIALRPLPVSDISPGRPEEPEIEGRQVTLVVQGDWPVSLQETLHQIHTHWPQTLRKS